MSFEAGSELGKANLEVFSETLLSLAERDSNVLAVTGDSRGSGKLLPFAEKLPDQIVEVGVAEQNLVGIAAGLASALESAMAPWGQPITRLMMWRRCGQLTILILSYRRTILKRQGLSRLLRR